MSVRAPETQSLNNVAEVTSDAFIDPDSSNNFAFVEHAITDVADLQVTKTGPATVVAGTSMQYDAHGDEPRSVDGRERGAVRPAAAGRDRDRLRAESGRLQHGHGR